MADTNLTLAESVDKAVADVEKPETPVVEEKETPVVEEKKEEAPAETDEDKELTLQGKQLMLALKDPEKAGIVIKFLAEQAGYSKIEDKKEAKAATDDVLDALKESLGEEYNHLTERLAPAIRKIMEKEIDTRTADIKARVEQQELDKLASKSEKVISKLATDFFEKPEPPPEITAEMSRLMDKYKPAADDSIEDYLKDIFNLAISNKGVSKPIRNDKINSNRTDAASRLASDRSGGEPSGSIVAPPPQKMSLDEAVLAAIETVKTKDK